MRNDIITATLPANMALVELQRHAAAVIEAKTSARQDSAMVERDLSRGARPPEPAAEDPLCAAVDAAILALREEMFECAVDECQNTGRDPDYTRADAAEADLLKAIDALIASRLGVKAAQVCDLAQVGNSGLLVEHKPGARVKGGSL